MDKAIRKVTQKIHTAEGKLRQAAKENTKLANYDEKVRDPMIKKCKAKRSK